MAKKDPFLQRNILKTFAKKPEVLGHYLGYKDLTQVHGQWIEKIWGEEDQTTFLLMAHRNSYKTTAVIVVGIIWYLFFNPDKTVLLVRKTYDGARETLGELRQHYMGKEVKDLYELAGVPNFMLAVDKEESIKLPTKTKITKEDSISISGVAGRGVTGGHYDRVHLDDVVTEMDRDSASERRRTKRFYYNLKSVVKPEGRITATGTPWHKNDLYSVMARYERYPLGTIAIKGFKDGYVADLKRELPPSQFASQYELKHSADEKQLFADPKMTDQWSDGVSYAHLDCAYGGDNTTALSIVSMTKSGIKVLGKVFKGHVQQWYEEIRQLMRKYVALTILLESNADKGLVRRDLLEMGITACGYHEKTHKHIKIMTNIFPYWQDIYFYKETDGQYLEQVETYNEHSEYDDAPDSLASLLRREGWRYAELKSQNERQRFSAETHSVSLLGNENRDWKQDFEKGIPY